MSFDPKFFEPVGGQARSGNPGATTPPGTEIGNSMAVWDYRSSVDSDGTIRIAGYFNFLRDMVYPGDSVIVKGNNDQLFLGFFQTVPRSPSTSNVVLDSKIMIAT